MKKLVITGGAGFVGSNLAVKIKKDNPQLDIIAFDNLKRRGSELNLPRLKENKITFFHGDVRNKEDLESIGVFDFMIECSAEPSVLAGLNDSPDYVLNTNLIGTMNCLEAVRKNNASLIFLSTSRVYPIGHLNSINLKETDDRFIVQSNQPFTGISSKGVSEQFPLDGSRSIYGATKLCSELLIEEYVAAYNLKAVINRCSVIAGPWQMGKVDQGVMVFWVARHLFGGELSYIGYGGTGKQVRDVLHIDDLYNLLKIQMKNMEKYSGKTYNVGGGEQVSVSLKELTSICNQVTGKTIKISGVAETRKADIPYYVTDCSKVHLETGWKPHKSVKEIVKDIAEWIKNNEDTVKPILK